MIKFINTKHGHVNLNHVVRFWIAMDEDNRYGIYLQATENKYPIELLEKFDTSDQAYVHLRGVIRD